MSLAEINNTIWEFVDTEGSEHRLKPEPDSMSGLPTRWRVFASESLEFVQMYVSGPGAVVEPLKSAAIDELSDIPETLEVGDTTIDGQDVDLDGDLLDFSALFRDKHDRVEGKMAYALATIAFDTPTELIIGMGADFWMQFWIDGSEVLNTCDTGNLSRVTSSNYCIRHRFDAGTHILAARAFSGGASWTLRLKAASAAEALHASGRRDEWRIMPELDIIRPPSAIQKRSLALRTDLCVVDETVQCDFRLDVVDGHFGVVLGAQDSGHYYWAYCPRWHMNWRARAFYAVIAKVDGNDHACGLAMMLMPNVLTHMDAVLSIKVERRGNHIQMYVNDVKGPLAIDDTYGAGSAGVAGFGDYEVRNFCIEGTSAEPTLPWRPDSERRQVWFTPTDDTGYGFIRQPYSLLKLSSGEILAGILSRHGGFYDSVHDPESRVNLYLSADSGRSWTPHGGPLTPITDIPLDYYWGMRWCEPEPGVIRAFKPGPLARSGIRSLDDANPEDFITFRDSHDKGLTWSDPIPTTMVGDWETDLYRPGCHNHVYGFTKLQDGTLLAVFLHQHDDQYKNVANMGDGTWGGEICQPYCSRSEDGGLSWQTPVPMDNAAYNSDGKPQGPHGGWSETTLSQIPFGATRGVPGRIVASCRPYRSPHGWQTHSDDGGRTWRQVCNTSFAVHNGPQLVATQSGYLTMIGPLGGVRLHTSVDGGVNWDAGTLISDHGWYNGFLLEVEPDVILTFKFQPSNDGRTPTMPRMQRIRITPDGPVPADA